MTIQDLGSVGELVGAVATVATLLYLAIQIRQNTNSVQSAGAASYREGNNTFNCLIAQDGALADIWYKGLEDPESLSQTELRQFEAVLSTFIVYLQQAEELEVAGGLSSELTHTRDVQIEFLVSQPGFLATYAKQGHYYPPKFASRIKDAVHRQSKLGAHEATSAAAQQSAGADSA